MKLIFISSAFAIGVFLGSIWIPGTVLLLFLIVGLLAVSVAAWKFKQTYVTLGALLIAVVLSGAVRYDWHKATLDKESLSAFNNTGELQIEGVITTDPVAKGSFVDFRLAVVRVRTDEGWQKAEGAAQTRARPGRALIQEREQPYFKYGDRVRIYGELEEPPQFEDFDYRQYLARQGVSSSIVAYSSELLETDQSSRIRAVAYSVRSALSDSLDGAMPAPSPVETGLAKALTLGTRSEVPPKLNQAFINSGTAHVLSVSGLHIAVLVSMMTLILGKTLGKANRLYFLMPLIFLWGYALITGLSPPVIRSAVMGSIYIWAVQSGRQRSGLIALAISAAIMLGIDPNLLWDVSFQLSFVSMLGLFVLSPPLLSIAGLLKQRLHLNESGLAQTAALLLDITAVNLSFMLASIPIIAFNFHNISLATLPASLLTIPALPLILPAVGITALLGLIWEPLGYAPGWIAWVGLKYLEAVVTGFGNMPFSRIDTGSFASTLLILYYTFMVFLVWIILKFLKAYTSAETSSENAPHILQNAWAWYGAFVLTASVFLWDESLSTSDRMLHLNILDTPGVNALLVKDDGGNNVLIDGGSVPAALSEELSRRLSFTDRIDTVIATQPTAQYMTGLSSVLSTYTPRNLITADPGEISNVEFAFQKQVAASGVKHTVVTSGASIRTSANLVVEVLHPPKEQLLKTGADVSNNSLVLRIASGGFSVLSLRGLRTEGMESLVLNNPELHSTVLSIAWINDRTMPTKELLLSVRPAMIIFTGTIDGQKKTFMRNAVKETLPDSSIMFAPEERTEIISDGSKIWLK